MFGPTPPPVVSNVTVSQQTDGYKLVNIRDNLYDDADGDKFSDDQLQRLLHQEGFSIHRPKHTLKGKRDEKAYCKAKKDLIRLGKKR